MRRYFRGLWDHLVHCLGYDHRLLNGLLRSQYLLNLTQLNPVSPNLHLAIAPSQPLQIAIRAVAAEVAGFVESESGVG